MCIRDSRWVNSQRSAVTVCKNAHQTHGEPTVRYFCLLTELNIPALLISNKVLSDIICIINACKSRSRHRWIAYIIRIVSDSQIVEVALGIILVILPPRIENGGNHKRIKQVDLIMIIGCHVALYWRAFGF